MHEEELFYEACATLLKERTLEAARALDDALVVGLNNSTVRDVENALVGMATRATERARINNSLIKHELECALLCCKLLLQLNSPNVLVFLTVLNHKELVNAALVAQCADLFVPKLSKIEPEFLYSLAQVSLNWVFSPDVNNEQSCAAHNLMGLVAACFVELKDDKARDKLIHEVLSLWFRHGGYFRAVDIVLTLVAAAGRPNEEVIASAQLISDKQMFEREAAARFEDALACSLQISRRIIDSTHSQGGSRRNDVLNFLGTIGDRLTSPQWPSAELFVTAFVQTMFRLVRVENKQYPLFIFACLRRIQCALSKCEIEDVEKESRSRAREQLTSLICNAISSCNQTQAYYLVARQCTLPDQPWLQLLKACKTRAEPPVDWVPFLRQWPIAHYAKQIIELLKELALNEQLKDAHQLELFRVLSQTDIFDIRYFRRLSYAPPAVCEALLQLAEKHMSEEVAELICGRLKAPGAPAYKRKALSVLAGARGNQVSTSTVWKAALLCAADDQSVKQDGFQLCAELVSEPPPAFNNDALLVKGLSAFLEDNALGVARERTKERIKERTKTAHQVRDQVRKLVSELIEKHELELVSQFVAADGTLLPPSLIEPMLALAEKKQSVERLYALSILDHALCARPRAILPRSVVASMFTRLLKLLSAVSDREITHVGSSLQQLTGLDTLAEQQRRSKILLDVVELKSLPLAKRTPHNLPLFARSVAIVGCMRFWTNNIKVLRETCYSLIELGRELPVLKAVFRIAGRHGLLCDAKISSFFDCKPLSIESQCVTALLLEYLNAKEFTESTGVSKKAFQKQETNSENSDDRTSSDHTGAVLQQHAGRILQHAREQNLTALRVVSQALESNLLVADDCVPTIVQLCFSKSIAVSQTALAAFQLLCERQPRNLGVRFAESLTTLKDTSSIPLFTVLFHTFVQQVDKPKLEQFCKRALRWEQSTSVLSLVIGGISSTELKQPQARVIAAIAESAAGRFEPKAHSNVECTNTVLIHLLAYWLRQRYGFSEYRRHARIVQRADAELPPFDVAGVAGKLIVMETEELRKKATGLWSAPDYFESAAVNELVSARAAKRARIR